MLMSTQANRFAHALIKAREAGTMMAPLTEQTDLSIADAYDIAKKEPSPDGVAAVAKAKAKAKDVGDEDIPF